MKIQLKEALDRIIELSEEKDVFCYYSHKNISMQMKVDSELTEQKGETYQFKDYYCSVSKVEFSIKDVAKFEYYTAEEAGKQNGDSGILVEHLAMYFEDGSELIIMEEI